MNSMITFVPGAKKLSEGKDHMEEHSEVNIKDNTVITNRPLPVPCFNIADCSFPLCWEVGFPDGNSRCGKACGAWDPGNQGAAMVQVEAVVQEPGRSWQGTWERQWGKQECWISRMGLRHPKKKQQQKTSRRSLQMGYRVGAMSPGQGKGLVTGAEPEARETLSLWLDSLLFLLTIGYPG